VRIAGYYVKMEQELFSHTILMDERLIMAGGTITIAELLERHSGNAAEKLAKLCR